MPWYVDERNCVMKGSAEKPGDEIKCHPDRKRAVDHMKALYATEPGLKNFGAVTIKRGGKKIPLVPGMYSYKQDGRDRWMAITTADGEDADGEQYGYEAIDWGLDWAKEHDYPELRVLHIRGLKAGMADRMSRIGPLAVDEGYYHDTALGKESRRVVDSGQMKISRGFSVVEALGTCPCGARLVVGPLGLKYAYKCTKCDQVYLGRNLKEVRFTKAIPFDLTITDSPAVPWTVIVNKSIKEDTMSREELIKRLVAAGFDTDIVTPIVTDMKDEDLVRAKEENCLEVFKEYVDAAVAAETPPTPDPTPETSTEVVMDDAVLGVFKELIAQTVKESLEGYTPEFTLPETMEIEIPAETFKGLSDQIAALKEQLDKLTASDEERLAEMNKDMSQSSRSFLKFRMATSPTKEPVDNPAASLGLPGVAPTDSAPIPMGGGVFAKDYDDYMEQMTGGVG